MAVGKFYLDNNEVSMEKIEISVICTSFNYERYIGHALDSIINQKTNFPFEIIVVDDCSTDHSRELLQTYKEKYPDLIRLFFNEKNKGLTRTWISICKEARGKYIARCDADDYWIDELKLQKQYDMLESDQTLLWCNTSFNIVDEKDNVLAEDVFRNGPIAYANSYEKMIATKGMTLTSSWLVDTKLMQDVNEVIDPDSVDDGFPMQLEFFKKTRLAFVDDPCVAYRMTSNSDSRPDSESKMIHRINGLLKTQLEYLEKYPEEDMANIAEILVRQDAKQEERIYFLNKRIIELEASLKNPNLGQVGIELITIYLDRAGKGFIEEDILQFPLEKADSIDLELPEDCSRIRIDLSEIPNFFQHARLVSTDSKKEILPTFTNGIVLGETLVFPNPDPQLIYDVSSQTVGKSLQFHYHLLELDNIHSDTYIGKVLAQEFLDAKFKIKDLQHEKIISQDLILKLQKEIEETTNLYNSVIHSRRWTIPTKIINFLRRKK